MVNHAGACRAGVISACRAIGRGEKRILSFFIRATFHDGLAVNATACQGGNFKTTNPACQGADSSALLTVEEMRRPENGESGALCQLLPCGCCGQQVQTPWQAKC